MTQGAGAENGWHRFSAGDVAVYAELTQDFNPIHLDAAFAAGTHMGRPIVFGTMSLALVFEALEQHYGSAALARCAVEVRFVRPVFVGDALQVVLGPPEETGRRAFSIITEEGVQAMAGHVEGLAPGDVHSAKGTA